MDQRLRTTVRPSNHETWRAPLILFGSVVTVSGTLCLVLDGTDLASQTCRAIGGLFLLLAGGIMWLLVWNRCRNHEWPAAGVVVTWRVFLQRLILGWLSSYVIALCVGPAPGIAWLFFGVFSLWCAVLFAWAAVPGQYKSMGLFTASTPINRLLGRAALIGLALLVVGEAGVRMFQLVTGGQPSASYVVHRIKPDPGTVRYGRCANSSGYFDDEFHMPRRPGSFRVAVLGDELALADPAQRKSLICVRNLPCVEVYNFGLPHAGPREYVAVFEEEVVKYRPDLVLCFVSVGTDITGAALPPGVFDWRWLQVCQIADRAWGAGTCVADSPRCLATAVASEDFTAVGRRMTVCRSPISPAVRRQWQEAVGHLEQLALRCRKRNTTLGLVVLPDKFQVNEVLRETLQRRIGCTNESIDVALPQRRLLVFANQQRIPSLDLLAPLQAAGATAFERRDHRLSPQGGDVVAEAVGDWLDNCFGLQIARVAGPERLTAARVVDATLRR